jgi:hypothetical protein
MWQDGVFNKNKVEDGQVQQFAAVWFDSIFGKALADFSEKEIKKVGEDLRRCSDQMWVEYLLENVFTNPRAFAGWQKNFEAIRDRSRKNKIEENRQAALERARQIGYPVDELLLQTPKFDVYTRISDRYQSEWCAPENGLVQINYVFKTGETAEILIDDNYWKDFENKILPILNERCDSARTIVVFNYVRGVYLYDDKVADRPNPGYTGRGRSRRGGYGAGDFSQEISRATYTPAGAPANKRSWQYDNDFIGSTGNLMEEINVPVAKLK